MTRPPRENQTPLVFAGGLLFVSGLASLLLQTLWMRGLGWLLGSSATSGAIVLTVFFTGLALGGRWGGRRTSATPLRFYALLEAAAAGFALCFLLLERVFVLAYGPLVAVVETAPFLFPVAAFLIAAPLLLPAAFCMGATLPVLSAFLHRDEAAQDGPRVALVYAANVLGGATGVVLATFFLPQWAGYLYAYLFGIMLLLLASGSAYLYSLRFADDSEASGADPSPAGDASNPWRDPDGWLAFASGFVVLAAEVLWLRLFARILQNSVYTYGIVMVVVLLGLGAGAFLATRLGGSRARMHGVMLGGALLIAVSPFLVHWSTEGLAYTGGRSDWGGYVAKVFGLAGLSVLPASCLLGLVFPWLLSVTRDGRAAFQRRVGSLLAINTVGGICGSACAGFVLLPLLGLHDALRLTAFVYPLLLVAILFASRSGSAAHAGTGPVAAATIGVLLLMITVFDPGRLPAVRFDPGKGESLLEAREGSHGQAVALQTKSGLRIKLDNHYTIGGTGARAAEERQSHLPLLLHPDPRRVFVLGLGTGITAGAVLRHPVQDVTVAELVPEIVELSRRHFTPYTGELFTDERVRVRAADGRWLLRARDDRYDVILGDLFTPWKAGVGDLYSYEHITSARERLAPGGIFVQWLPLYQMTMNEYGTVARTMLEVFPRVTVWRGDFFAGRNIIALVGHSDTVAFDPVPARRRLKQARSDAREGLRELAPALARLREGRDARTEVLSSLLMYYAGDLTARKSDFLEFPLNTDDSAVIQWRAPISLRRVRAGRDEWVVGPRLLREFDLNFNASAPDRDPYLARLTDGERRYVRAGLLLHRMVVWKEAGARDRALGELRELKRLLGE